MLLFKVSVSIRECGANSMWAPHISLLPQLPASPTFSPSTSPAPPARSQPPRANARPPRLPPPPAPLATAPAPPQPLLGSGAPRRCAVAAPSSRRARASPRYGGSDKNRLVMATHETRVNAGAVVEAKAVEVVGREGR
ncbi:hypothetical protein C2845_PM16G09900 [Panicum miliaceum]|uniref:Uncharacterized protein n=1 Tax=Panicum miliaceum TaxID=4540 RepID=A0A3L6PVL5_PANMI|nr:hypothetical protein C2845_PM16G09900 [Panicum miliaceum]